MLASAVVSSMVLGCGSGGSDSSSSGGVQLSGEYTTTDTSAPYAKIVFAYTSHTYEAVPPSCTTSSCVTKGTYSLSGSTLTLNDTTDDETIEITLQDIESSTSALTTSSSSSIRPLDCSDLVCAATDAGADLVSSQMQLLAQEQQDDALIAAQKQSIISDMKTSVWLATQLGNPMQQGAQKQSDMLITFVRAD